MLCVAHAYGSRLNESRYPMWPDALSDLRPLRVLGHLEFEVRLEIHPELRRSPKIPA